SLQQRVVIGDFDLFAVYLNFSHIASTPRKSAKFTLDGVPSLPSRHQLRCSAFACSTQPSRPIRPEKPNFSSSLATSVSLRPEICAYVQMPSPLSTFSSFGPIPEMTFRSSGTSGFVIATFSRTAAFETGSRLRAGCDVTSFSGERFVFGETTGASVC